MGPITALADLQNDLHTSREVVHADRLIWGFPKIRGTILGVPIIRIIVFGGLYWGPPILGNSHIVSIKEALSITLCSKYPL